MSIAETTATGTTTWTIDPAHTTVEFSVKHLMISTVRGHFGGVTGTIVLDEQNPLASTVTVSTRFSRTVVYANDGRRCS